MYQITHLLLLLITFAKPAAHILAYMKCNLGAVRMHVLGRQLCSCSPMSVDIIMLCSVTMMHTWERQFNSTKPTLAWQMGVVAGGQVAASWNEHRLMEFYSDTLSLSGHKSNEWTRWNHSFTFQIIRHPRISIIVCCCHFVTITLNVRFQILFTAVFFSWLLFFLFPIKVHNNELYARKRFLMLLFVDEYLKVLRHSPLTDSNVIDLSCLPDSFAHDAKINRWIIVEIKSAFD